MSHPAFVDETTPTARALMVLEMVQNSPGIRGEQLADRLGMTDRAVRRYVGNLRDTGIPVESTRGKYGGYRIGRGVRLAPLMFTAPEALALVMAVLEGRPHDPTDAVGRLLFNVLAMVAEFESDLIRLRTREGMKVAKASGRLCGKQPKLNRRQEAHLVSLVHSGEYSTLEVAELFGVGRSTVFRAIERQRIAAKADIADSPARR